MRAGSLLLVLALLALVVAALAVGARWLAGRRAAHGGAPAAGPVRLAFRGRAVAAGQKVSITDAGAAPDLWLTGDGAPGALYTVLMYDPDAPSRDRPSAAPWRHWVALDVRADPAGRLQTAGARGEPYAGPSPPPGSGPHRYVVEVYQQAGPLPGDVPLAPERSRWDAAAFARDNGLRLVGQAVFVAER
jgi:hypothetical protein